MADRTASCSCGQLRLLCAGAPVRVSICHCLECQKRTGSVFAAQARYPRDRVTIEGRATTWSRRGESGASATFHFCPDCGSTVYWEPSAMPDLVLIAVGAFADPDFPPPHVSVYETRQHPWVAEIGQWPMERHL